MMMVRGFTICVLMLLAIGQLAGQGFSDEKESRLFFATEMGYLKGIGNVTFDDVKRSNDGFGARLQFITGYHVNEHFSGGLGFGLDGYFDPSYYTLPIFVEAKGYLKDAKSTPFAFLDIGYALKVTDDFGKGLMSNFGIGYKLHIGITRKAHLMPTLGINLQNIRGDRRTIETSQFPPQLVTVQDNIILSSFSISLAVEY